MLEGMNELLSQNPFTLCPFPPTYRSARPGSGTPGKRRNFPIRGEITGGSREEPYGRRRRPLAPSRTGGARG